MTEITIRMADDAADFEVGRALCREWLDWHWRHYPNNWPRGAGSLVYAEEFRAQGVFDNTSAAVSRAGDDRQNEFLF